MSVYAETIIPAQTGGIISEERSASGGMTIAASAALGEGEGIKVQITSNGTDYYDLYLNGVLQEIDEKHSIISLHGPMKFRCVKSPTGEAVGVVLWRTEVQ